MTGRKSKIVYRPLPTDDPRQRKPDISRAQNFLKWSPATPLSEGLAKTIAYFEGKLSADSAEVSRGRMLQVVAG